MSRPRINRLRWSEVTNELVMAFAKKDCPDCEGCGAVYLTDQATGETSPPRVCRCADAPFKAEYEGRLRRNKRGRLEFRAMASVRNVEEYPVREPGDIAGALEDITERGITFMRKEPA